MYLQAVQDMHQILYTAEENSCIPGVLHRQKPKEEVEHLVRPSTIADGDLLIGPASCMPAVKLWPTSDNEAAFRPAAAPDAYIASDHFKARGRSLRWLTDLCGRMPALHSIRAVLYPASCMHAPSLVLHPPAHHPHNYQGGKCA